MFSISFMGFWGVFMIEIENNPDVRLNVSENSLNCVKFNIYYVTITLPHNQKLRLYHQNSP